MTVLADATAQSDMVGSTRAMYGKVSGRFFGLKGSRY